MIGVPKGGGQLPSTSSLRCVAAFWNTASDERHGGDPKKALYKYGTPALQKAFDEEARDTLDYLAREYGAVARSVGIKTLVT